MGIEVGECHPIVCPGYLQMYLLKTEYNLDEPLIWLSTNSHMSLYKAREAWGDWIEMWKR